MNIKIITVALLQLFLFVPQCFSSDGLILVRQVKYSYYEICPNSSLTAPTLGCESLKYNSANNQIIEIAPYIAKIIKDNRRSFVNICKKFQISPVALAGAFAAENTMNVSIEDIVQDRLPYGMTGNYTVGLGQLSVPIASSVEHLVQKVEGRKHAFNSKQIDQRIRTVEGSITYGAALLRQYALDYGRAGFDIRGRPDILATLYNIGKSSSRINRTIRERRLPTINYFGYFVYRHYQDLNNLLIN